ncbi:MAG: hypothetical protein VX644_06750 [Planctomycetota bacterium]|nr:hypothetical protein [Planctomycetota bacterium]
MMRKMLLIVITVLGVQLDAGSAWSQQWGHLTARFVFDGEAPKRAPVVVNKDAAVCGKLKLLDETLVVNPKNGGIGNVVVFLRDTKKPAIHPDYAKGLKEKVIVNNLNCRFEPRVALVRTGQTIVLGNKDSVGHNTKIDTFFNPGVNPLIPAGAQLEQKFMIEERLPARVSCSIHAWMGAWLVVRSNPYFAASDADGKIHIKNIPAGEWEFQFWQEKSGYVRSVTVGGKKTDWKRGRVDLKIPAGKTLDLGDVVVDKKLFE